METYTQYIELINDYLNNVLSKEARVDFESQLQNDTAFNTIYQEHMVFINGLERIEIKSNIQNAKRSYYTEKWLKISGFSILVIGALVMLYTLVFNTSEMEPTPNSDTFKAIMVDSTSTTLSNSEPTIDSISRKKVTKGILVAESPLSEEKLIDKSTNNPLRKQKQILRINTQKDTIITCKEGTLLKIAKRSFINPKTGKTMTGTIDLKVTEYYKLSDILLANLSTVSNDRQLETGGMLYIEATQGAIELELKDDKPIDISFPILRQGSAQVKNKKNDMKLFSGEWKDKNINWRLQDDNLVDDLLISEENIDVSFNVVEVVPMFPGCEGEVTNDAKKKCTSNAISKFITSRFNSDLAIGLGLTGRQRINSIFRIDKEGNIVSIQSRGSHPRMGEEADRVIRLLPKMIPGKQRGKAVNVPYALPIRFEVLEDEALNKKFISTDVRDTSFTGTLATSQPAEMDTIYTSNRGIVEFIREVMHDKDFPVDSLFINEWERYKTQKLIRNISIETKPNYLERAIVLRQPLFEMEGSKFKILEDDSITRGGHIIRIPWDDTKIPTTTRVMTLAPKRRFSIGTEAVTAQEFETRLGNETDTTMSSRDVGYYVLKTSNLGWINCDRFINGRTNRITYELKIKNAEGANINMVFKSLNSVLPSWYTNDIYDFRTVGANEDVTLVGIKRKNGKLYYDAIDTKTEANPIVDFDFKEVSVEQLKKELEKLNRNFK